MGIENLEPGAARAAMESEPDHVFVDVRTVEEYEAGQPAGSVNVPWAVRDPGSGQMAHNPQFLPTMQKHYTPDTRLFLSCQAGMRSFKACNELEQAGYSNLVNIDGGFGGRRDPGGTVVVPGWQASKLPVSNEKSGYSA